MFDHEEEEILDVVNDNDEVIDQIKRSDMLSLAGTTGHYLRAIDIFIQRPNGDIYLPRRSTEKKIAPGGLDSSVGGHVMTGETYEVACLRELREEAGIDATMDDLQVITKFKPSPALFYFRIVYLLRTDKEPALSPEHTEALWVAPANLAEVVENDIPTKQTLSEYIPVLLDFLNR